MCVCLYGQCVGGSTTVDQQLQLMGDNAVYWMVQQCSCLCGIRAWGVALSEETVKCINA